MKNKLLYLVLIVLLLGLVGCKNSSVKNGSDYDSGNKDVITENNPTLPNRKIIYKVNATMTTNNLSESLSTIKGKLNDDEWLDSENISKISASLVIRVKTERLDEFINSIYKNHEVTSFNKIATDISLTYQDKSNLILTYQKERDRLLELYDEATLSDMIMINNRLSQIEVEIGKLQGELNLFDSLVEYSEVKLTITEATSIKEESFVNRIKNSFSNGLSGLIIFIEAFIMGFVTLIPWIVVFIPIGLIVHYLTKKNKKKRNNSTIR